MFDSPKLGVNGHVDGITLVTDEANYFDGTFRVTTKYGLDNYPGRVLNTSMVHSKDPSKET